MSAIHTKKSLENPLVLGNEAFALFESVDLPEISMPIIELIDADICFISLNPVLEVSFELVQDFDLFFRSLEVLLLDPRLGFPLRCRSTLFFSLILEVQVSLLFEVLDTYEAVFNLLDYLGEMERLRFQGALFTDDLLGDGSFEAT